jgi:hypothetical protein
VVRLVELQGCSGMAALFPAGLSVLSAAGHVLQLLLLEGGCRGGDPGLSVLPGVVVWVSRFRALLADRLPGCL